jgi:hypothetical protein
MRIESRKERLERGLERSTKRFEKEDKTEENKVD